MSGYGSPSFGQPPPGRVTHQIWPLPTWPQWDAMPAMVALPTAPAQVRVQVRTALLTWDMSGLTDAAELVATELTSNAVRASEKTSYPLPCQRRQVRVIGLCLLTDGARLRIEVWDQAAGFPILTEADLEAERGRGLTLVDAITRGHWGWHPAAVPWAAKCVWAEIRHPTPEASPPPTTAVRHPNAETGERNMTTTETELAPSTVTGVESRPRELITPGLFSKLTWRVMATDGYDQGTAERIVEQALAFLAACARYADRQLSPSEEVDAGWHAFILHTADYAEFCQRVAGRFIHHRPNGPGEAVPDRQAIGVTITAMRDVGLPVDPGLWVPRAQCSQCYQGCADDPKGA
jgi:hypothetical protein